MYDLFISYSTKDRDFVDSLCARLKKKGVRIWIDRIEIKPGEYLRDKIGQGIDNARYIIPVISPNSIKSEWVKREIDTAMIREIEEKNIVVVPLLMSDVSTTDVPSD